MTSDLKKFLWPTRKKVIGFITLCVVLTLALNPAIFIYNDANVAFFLLGLLTLLIGYLFVAILMNTIESPFDSGIRVVTDKDNYLLGDTINCTCELDLDEPIKARKLVAVLRRVRNKSRLPWVYDEETIFYTINLGEARVYNKGEKFEFSFKIDEKVAPTMPMGVLSRAISILSGNTGALRRAYPVVYEVYVSLDISQALNKIGRARPIIGVPIA